MPPWAIARDGQTGLKVIIKKTYLSPQFSHNWRSSLFLNKFSNVEVTICSSKWSQCSMYNRWTWITVKNKYEYEYEKWKLNHTRRLELDAQHPALYHFTQWPWPLNFSQQNLISSSFSQDAPLTKVCRKSVKAYRRYHRNKPTLQTVWFLSLKF